LKLHTLNKKTILFLPDAAIDFSSSFRFKNSENKVSILTKSEKIYHSHTRGMGFNMSFGFITEKKYPKSLINVEKFLKSMG
jgi:uracil DNA glycosylase